MATFGATFRKKWENFILSSGHAVYESSRHSPCFGRSWDRIPTRDFFVWRCIRICLQTIKAIMNDLFKWAISDLSLSWVFPNLTCRSIIVSQPLDFNGWTFQHSLKMVDPGLYIKADSMNLLNTLHMVKLSMSHGFTMGVSVDVPFLQINDNLEHNLPYVQSNFTCNPDLTLQRMYDYKLHFTWGYRKLF